jgi:hypothetical protein
MSTREITKQLNVIVIMEIVAESITISIITCIGIRYIYIYPHGYYTVVFQSILAVGRYTIDVGNLRRYIIPNVSISGY